MTKQKTLMLAMAGAALVAAAQARAAGPTDTYSADDLLLNFRNPANTTSGSDLEVNLGPVSDLTSGTVASSALVTGVFGTIGSSGVTVGLSATAGVAQNTTGELFYTRQDTASDAAANVAPYDLYGGTLTGAAESTQNQIGVKIGNIGSGYNAGTAVNGFANASTVTAATAGNSYQAQGEQNTTTTGQQSINFALVTTALSKGGTIESIQDGSASVYEALFDYPASGTANYLGYFTFQTDGEVDFTAAPSAVPEPATYGMIAGLGLAGLALRRQIRGLSV